MTDAERNELIERCLAKTKFKNKAQAEGAAISASHRGLQLTPYRCRVCLDWHLTKILELDIRPGLAISDGGYTVLLSQAIAVSGLPEDDVLALVSDQEPDWTDDRNWRSMSAERRLAALIVACMAEDQRTGVSR